MSNLLTDLLANAATGDLDSVLRVHEVRRNADLAQKALTVEEDVKRHYDYASDILPIIPACTTRRLITTLYSMNAKLIDRTEILKTSYNSQMAAILKNEQSK